MRLWYGGDDGNQQHYECLIGDCVGFSSVTGTKRGMRGGADYGGHCACDCQELRQHQTAGIICEDCNEMVCRLRVHELLPRICHRCVPFEHDLRYRCLPRGGAPSASALTQMDNNDNEQRQGYCNCRCTAGAPDCTDRERTLTRCFDCFRWCCDTCFERDPWSHLCHVCMVERDERQAAREDSSVMDSGADISSPWGSAPLTPGEPLACQCNCPCINSQADMRTCRRCARNVCDDCLSTQYIGLCHACVPGATMVFTDYDKPGTDNGDDADGDHSATSKRQRDHDDNATPSKSFRSEPSSGSRDLPTPVRRCVHLNGATSTVVVQCEQCSMQCCNMCNNGVMPNLCEQCEHDNRTTGEMQLLRQQNNWSKENIRNKVLIPIIFGTGDTTFGTDDDNSSLGVRSYHSVGTCGATIYSTPQVEQCLETCMARTQIASQQEPKAPTPGQEAKLPTHDADVMRCDDSLHSGNTFQTYHTTRKRLTIKWHLKVPNVKTFVTATSAATFQTFKAPTTVELPKLITNRIRCKTNVESKDGSPQSTTSTVSTCDTETPQDP